MALIKCPECGNMISDRAEKCPHCGLPSAYFFASSEKKDAAGLKEIDYGNLHNVLLSFDRDYAELLSPAHYVSGKDRDRFRAAYEKYYAALGNELIFRYVSNHASEFRIDTAELNGFIRRMRSLDADVVSHNEGFVSTHLARNKEYFDGILRDIDPEIKLDEEQRRAVVVDDDYCLLVAGAGAGKTTTMAAKVKYLVDK